MVSAQNKPNTATLVTPKPQASQPVIKIETNVVAPKVTAPERSVAAPERHPVESSVRKSPAVERPEVTFSKPTIPAPNVSASVAPTKKVAPVQPGTPDSYTINTITNNSASSSQRTTYVDNTKYRIDESNDSPEVRLSERSTGCVRVFRKDERVLAGDCYVPNRNANVANNGRNSGGMSSQSGEEISQFRINSQAPTAVRPINVGPVRVSSRGMRVNREETARSNVSLNTSQNLAYYNPGLLPLIRNNNGNTSFIFPLSIPAPVTSTFGWRIHPITGTSRFHQGTDLGAPMGTPIIAVNSGRVAIADWMGGYGLAVVLQHNPSQETLYGHMSEIFVQPGQWVEQGTVIGLVGSTGNSTGPHLHFEIREMTNDGWVATDAGMQLEYAVNELVRALQSAQAKPQSKGG
jgi:murein DD-endopeptidase MepM/ murein hydrolase activator NlpD